MDTEEKLDIVEERAFLDSKGHQVKQFSQVFGKDKRPNLYNGMVAVRMQIPTPYGMSAQNINLEFHFPPGTTLKTAFEKFDDEAKKCMDKFKDDQQKRMAEKRIVSASSVPPLLGANGKPIG